MERIDFHIHTIATVSDQDFAFEQSVLVDYVSELSLDAIAITNHNQFDKQQYESICGNLSIPVFPGIEIDIEKGHLLVITSYEDIADFVTRCERVSALVSAATDYLSASQFKEIFPSVDKYILIPHYEKSPTLLLDKVPFLTQFITCGEVNSIKKFESCKKAEDKLTPVFFSDIRIKRGLASFPARYTYVDVDTISISSIKQAFADKSKVALSLDDGHQLTDILSNGLKISTGLTVLLGERSSGKTHTLDEISKNVDNPKYIRQFSLLTRDAELDEKKFEETLRNRCASISEDYLMPFKNVVEDVRSIFLDRDEAALEDYVKVLLKLASDADKEDVFSKTSLFSEPLFDSSDLSSLEKLISAVNVLIENKEFAPIIYQFVNRQSLISLAVALMKKYAEEKELLLIKAYLNDILETIKAELRVRTAAIPIPDIDFYNLLMNKRKVNRFIQIANVVKREKVIYSKELHSFSVVATARPFTGAKELKNLSGKILVFSDAFAEYDEPYRYLCILRNKEELPVSDYYKYFVSIKYEVFNKYGFRASGGERSEYNLLEQLSDATQYDILLLDEPESSFDNLFLKSDVNKLIKDISQIVPVVVATHNNTIGASVKPDYILYTRKVVSETGEVTYQIFSGFPTSAILTELGGEVINKHDVLLDCLEAGEPAYIERRTTYEMPAD